MNLTKNIIIKYRNTARVFLIFSFFPRTYLFKEADGGKGRRRKGRKKKKEKEKEG